MESNWQKLPPSTDNKLTADRKQLFNPFKANQCASPRSTYQSGPKSNFPLPSSSSSTFKVSNHYEQGTSWFASHQNYYSLMVDLYHRNLFERLVMPAAAAAAASAAATVMRVNGLDRRANIKSGSQMTSCTKRKRRKRKRRRCRKVKASGELKRDVSEITDSSSRNPSLSSVAGAICRSPKEDSK